jgi:hypothetical protein
MHFTQYKRFLGACFLGIISSFLQAQGSGQNGTRSPFSNYGLGEWTQGNFFQSNTAMHTHSGYYSYSLYNPATVGSIRYTTLDFGGNYKEGIVKSGDAGQSFTGGGLNYLSLAFPIWKHLQKRAIGFDSAKQSKIFKYVPYGAASSLVLRPMTTVGYNYYIDNNAPIPNRTAHTGSGGINLLQWNTGFRFGNHAQVGYGLGYVFGTLKDNTLFSIIDSLHLGLVEDAKSIIVRGVQHQFGFVANFKIDSTYHKFGGSYEVYSGMAGTETRLTRSLNYAAGYTSVRDTVLNEIRNAQSFSMPTAYGLGYGFQFRRAFSLSLDYRKQIWGSNPFFDTKGKYTDRTDMGVSFVIHPNDEKAASERRMKIPVRFGYMLSNTQQIFSNGGSDHQIQEHRYTFGFGLPLIQRYYDNSVITNMVNFSVQYLQRGVTGTTLPSEQYLIFGIGLQLGDIWFAKRKFD